MCVAVRVLFSRTRNILCTEFSRHLFAIFCFTVEESEVSDFTNACCSSQTVLSKAEQRNDVMQHTGTYVRKGSEQIRSCYRVPFQGMT